MCFLSTICRQILGYALLYKLRLVLLYCCIASQLCFISSGYHCCCCCCIAVLLCCCIAVLLVEEFNDLPPILLIFLYKVQYQNTPA